MSPLLKTFIIFVGMIQLSIMVNSQGTAIRVVNRGASVLGEVHRKTDTWVDCEHTKDLSKFANCAALKRTEKCKAYSEKMRYYCPVTCGFCNGATVGVTTKASAPDGPPCKTSLHGCCKDGETEARGRNFLGCPEKCFDTPNYSCSFYKSIDFCDLYKDQMLHRCPRTCEMCQPPGQKKKPTRRPKNSTEECIDVWEPKMCTRLERFRLCEVKKWSVRLSQKCRKTCRKCAKDTPPLLSVAQPCAKEGTCCWDKSKRENGICPVCRDSFSQHFCKRFKYDCIKNTAIKSVQIRVLCPKTCGMCNSQSVCKDDIVYWDFCLQWKKQGECKKNPEIMSVYCKKTCRFCK